MNTADSEAMTLLLNSFNRQSFLRHFQYLLHPHFPRQLPLNTETLTRNNLPDELQRSISINLLTSPHNSLFHYSKASNPWSIMIELYTFYLYFNL